MASIQSVLSRYKDLRGLCGRLTGLNLVKSAEPKEFLRPQNQLKASIAGIHSTLPRYDLMEFFDNQKNWSKNEVRCGRSWLLDELRIKSNSDLHKLWYVLLKEKNMLMTMEHEANEKFELFPSPERYDKVQDSMNNIETVIRERNRAYYKLEIGTDGERPGRVEPNRIGMRYFYRTREYFIPKRKNKKFKTHFYNEYLKDQDVETFLKFYREKLWNIKRRARNRDRQHVTKLLSRFPNMDRNMLKRKYPDVNIDHIEDKDRARGHFAPRID